MQIELRPASNQKVVVVNNKVYKSDRNIRVKVFPIPNFIKEPKCLCGKEAIAMEEEMNLICARCLQKKLETKVVLTSVKDMSIPLTEETIKRMRFEWSTDGDRWYYVHGKNLRPSNWDILIERIKKMVVQDAPITLEAEYRKETKELEIIF